MSILIDKINSAKYIYSSNTKWGLNKYVCDIEYYTEEPLDDLYYVICSILDSEDGGYYDKYILGIMLGFSMKDKISNGKHEVYYDVAEVHIFDDILKKVESEHLIKTDERYVYLTELGRISVQEKKHYQFFIGTQDLYEHSSLKSSKPTNLLLFPFYVDMGISTNIRIKKQIWPDDDIIKDIIYYKTDHLKARLALHSEKPFNIYKAELEPYYDLEIIKVPVKLYQYNEEYIPAIMHGDSLADKATELVCEDLNSLKRENIVLECLFQKLWDDKSAILDYIALEPYVELVDYEELTKDARTVWSDNQLFDLIVKYATPTCWRNVSRYCNIDILHKYIDKYKDYLDWPILTERIDDGFLLDNFHEYPWDLEILSEDVNRKISVIEKLITLQKDTEEDWNWYELEHRLTRDFVLSHLDIVKIDLSSYTIDTDEIRQAILRFIDKRWNWSIIETQFDLQFIYDNINELSHHLCFTQLFDRVFTDSNWAIKFTTNNQFRSVVAKASKDGGMLSSAIFNDKDYIWSDTIIDLFLENKLLSWGTTPYMVGFECNPHIVWTEVLFKKYCHNITSQEGYAYVSSQIKDIDIIIDSPEFEWNWDVISSNKSLLSDIRLYSLYGTRLNWNNVIENLADTSFLQSIHNINSLIGGDFQAWSSFSTKADIDYVIKTYRESQYPWDWTVLTKRMFQQLKLENLGNKLFVNQWDWAYLSGHVGADFLITNLEKYNQYWDWGVALPRIFIIENKFNYTFLNRLARIITNISLPEKRKDAWTALTSQYAFRSLKKLIKDTIGNPDYCWDIDYFCQHNEFNIFSDLEICRNLVNWDILSSSPAVDNSFKFNRKLGIKVFAWHEEVRNVLTDDRNHWDFMSLSHFESLRDEKWFISQFKDYIDWEFISASSKIFCENDKQLLNDIIDAYKSYIDFKALSRRNDVDIRQILKINQRGNYDFNDLAKRHIINIDLQLVEKMPNYPWDWQMVSSSPSFNPTSEFLLSHIKYDLNWEALSSQDNDKAWSDEHLILVVASNATICKQIDWYSLSSKNYFPLTYSILHTVPANKLNWKRLSGRKAIGPFVTDFTDFIDWSVLSDNRNVITLDLDCLEKYKDYLDWNVICRKNDFVFTNEILEKFSKYIDWDLASESLSIQFSNNLVDKYKDKWNWPVLVKNKAFNNKVELSEMPYVKQLNIVDFIKKFPRAPKAYHFTHMENAVKIIQSMKLQSRNYADGNFSNSAGTNVNRTEKAHGFARFYFMPKSPTQFYNEFLGKDIDDKYYQRALNLGLPKCPLPVFFLFDIQELLSVMPDLCYYSNGNMQKDSSKCFKVIENPNRIKAKEIYVDCYDTKDERQQEFLVEGELDFSKLKDVRICCCDNNQADMLKQELKGTKWEDVVSVDNTLYEHENKELFYMQKPDTIKISTNYRCPYEFRISYSGSQVPGIVNTNNVIRQRGNNIYVSDSVEIKKDTQYEIYFEVNRPRSGSWLIYKNK